MSESDTKTAAQETYHTAPYQAAASAITRSAFGEALELQDLTSDALATPLDQLQAIEQGRAAAVWIA